MNKVKFFSAKNLKEALNYLSEINGVRILAGGTDLLVEWRNVKQNINKSVDFLDISGIDELKYIRKKGDYLEIGALTTHTMLLEDSLIKEHFPLIAKAAKTIGSTQIRNRGTLGGNINNASPAADLIPPLVAFQALIQLKSRNGSRVLPLEKFITGPYRTDRREDELMTGIRIPLTRERLYGSFQRIGRRRALSIARLNLALVCSIGDGYIWKARVVPGSATPYPVIFLRTLGELVGRKLADINPALIGEIAAEELVELAGERWSTPYKKPALATLVKRALLEIQKEVLEDD